MFTYTVTYACLTPTCLANNTEMRPTGNDTYACPTCGDTLHVG